MTGWLRGKRRSSSTTTQSQKQEDHPLVAGHRALILGKEGNPKGSRAFGAFQKAQEALDSESGGRVGIGGSSAVLGGVNPGGVGFGRGTKGATAAFGPITVGQQQDQAIRDTIESARVAQDYSKDVLAGTYLDQLQEAENPLQRLLASVQQEQAEHLENNVLRGLNTAINANRAFGNARVGTLVSDTLGEQAEADSQALADIVYRAYAGERGLQDKASEDLLRSHGFLNALFGVIQQDENRQRQYAAQSPFAALEAYNNLINANRLGYQTGTSTTNQTASGSSLDGLIKLAGIFKSDSGGQSAAQGLQALFA